MAFADLFSPENMPMLGLIQGLGQAAMPSRLPVPMGAAMGAAVQGLLQGRQNAFSAQQQQQQLEQGKLGLATGQLGLQKDYLGLAQTLGAMNYYRQRAGQAPLNMSDLTGQASRSFGLSSDTPQQPASTSAPPTPAAAPSAPAPNMTPPDSPMWGSRGGSLADDMNFGAPQQAPIQPAPIQPASASGEALGLNTAAPILQKTLGVPVQITSGLRDAAHNAAVGGVSNSAHLAGDAVDFVPHGMSTGDAVGQLANSGIPFDQLIDEGSHVHIAWGGKQRGQVLVKTQGGYQHITPSASPVAQGSPAPEQVSPVQPSATVASQPPPDPLSGLDQIGMFNPQAAMQAELKFMEPQNVRPGGSVAAYNPATGRYEQYFYQPTLPQSSHVVNGQVVEYPGGPEAAANQSYATAAGGKRAEAQYGPVIAGGEEGARLAQQLRFNPAIAAGEAAGKAAVEDAHTLVDVYDPVTQQTIKVPRAAVLGSSGPVASGAPGAPVAPGGQPTSPTLRTTQGVPIPLPPRATGSLGAATGPSFGQEATQKAVQQDVNGWFGNYQSNAQAAQRIMASADALKQIKSGAWAEDKADFARQLIAAGINKDAVNQALGDPAQLQILVKNNFATAVNALKGVTNRVTQAEIFAASKNLQNPSLEPAANLAIMGQTLGVAKYNMALRDDWLAAQRAGWTDPAQFESWWQSQPQHGLQSFVNKAEADIGPLKGMKPAADALPGNARMQLKGGQYTTFRNGQVWTLQGGQPVRVQ